VRKYIKRFSFIFPALFLLASCQSKPKESLRINFIIDKAYDAEMIYWVLGHSHDPSGLASRSKLMGIDLSFAKKVSEAENYDAIRNKLNTLVDARYKKHLPQMKRSLKEYKISWEPITTDFAQAVVSITEHPFFYPDYTCIVSAFHPGTSEWYGHTITRMYGEDPYKQRRITAHEIVLSQIFHIVRKYYSKEQIDDKKVWAISEITTVFVLNEPELMKFWPWSKNVTYLKMYSLGDKKRKMGKLWKERTSFTGYLKAAI